jgi:hypothetical protein
MGSTSLSGFFPKLRGDSLVNAYVPIISKFTIFANTKILAINSLVWLNTHMKEIIDISEGSQTQDLAQIEVTKTLEAESGYRKVLEEIRSMGYHFYSITEGANQLILLKNNLLSKYGGKDSGLIKSIDSDNFKKLIIETLREGGDSIKNPEDIILVEIERAHRE